MPTVEGLVFAYSLYALPPGRLPFRRWRWELWHGANLLAAGWRLSRPDAGRALRLYAAAHGPDGARRPEARHDRTVDDRPDHRAAGAARAGPSARRALGASWPCARR